MYNFQIKLNTENSPLLCGLCGNADGDMNNEFVSSSNYYFNDDSKSLVNMGEFGDSWKIDP